MRVRPALLALVMVAAAATSLVATAASPGSGAITPTSTSVKWDGATWPAGAAAVLQIGSGVEPVCPPKEADPTGEVCDHYTLTVNVPATYWEARPGGIRVTATWPDPNNKLEIIAHDASGKLVGWGLSGGRSTLIIPNAHGVYDVVVTPSIVVRPTSYVGTAQIIDLPPSAANPSLGGPTAYAATPVAIADPDHPVRNRPTPYFGQMLQLAAHPIGHTGPEPTLGIDKAGTVYINAKDVGQLPAYGEIHPPRVYASRDHGKSWHDAGSQEANTAHFSTSDPYLYVDPDYGRVYWLDLQFPEGTLTSFTDDHGESWTSAFATPLGVNDHQTLIAARPPAGSNLVAADAAFPKVVYYCANQVTNVACVRSLDGGRTFARVGSPLLEQSLGCVVSTTDHLSADKDGRIYIGSSGCNIPMVGMSSDGGMTWTNTAVTTKILAAYHDVATATDTAGNVYAAFTDDAHGLPYLAFSRNHGQTWSTPVMVAPPDVHETGMLTLAVGAPGHVAVGFVTTTVDNPGDDGRPWSYRMAVSRNALDPKPVFVSNVATLPDLKTKLVSRGGCCRGMADFLDMQRTPNGPGAAWGSLSVPCTDSKCQGSRTGVNNLSSGKVYAVEQVAGPALLAAGDLSPVGRPAPAAARPVAQPAPTATGPLPATGPSLARVLSAGLGLLLLLTAVAVRRARTRLTARGGWQ